MFNRSSPEEEFKTGRNIIKPSQSYDAHVSSTMPSTSSTGGVEPSPYRSLPMFDPTTLFSNGMHHQRELNVPVNGGPFTASTSSTIPASYYNMSDGGSGATGAYFDSMSHPPTGPIGSTPPPPSWQHPSSLHPYLLPYNNTNTGSSTDMGASKLDPFSSAWAPGNGFYGYCNPPSVMSPASTTPGTVLSQYPPPHNHTTSSSSNTKESKSSWSPSNNGLDSISTSTTGTAPTLPPTTAFNNANTPYNLFSTPWMAPIPHSVPNAMGSGGGGSMPSPYGYPPYFNQQHQQLPIGPGAFTNNPTSDFSSFAQYLTGAGCNGYGLPPPLPPPPAAMMHPSSSMPLPSSFTRPSTSSPMNTIPTPSNNNVSNVVVKEEGKHNDNIPGSPTTTTSESPSEDPVSGPPAPKTNKKKSQNKKNKAHTLSITPTVNSSTAPTSGSNSTTCTTGGAGSSSSKDVMSSIPLGHQCPYPACPFQTSQLRVMDSHVRTHSILKKGKKKVYVCDREKCGYMATDASNYKAHMRVHMGSKPFQCNVDGCNYAATQKVNLRIHMERHHSMNLHNSNSDTVVVSVKVNSKEEVSSSMKVKSDEDVVKEGKRTTVKVEVNHEVKEKDDDEEEEEEE